MKPLTMARGAYSLFVIVSFALSGCGADPAFQEVATLDAGRTPVGAQEPAGKEGGQGELDAAAIQTRQPDRPGIDVETSHPASSVDPLRETFSNDAQTPVVSDGNPDVSSEIRAGVGEHIVPLVSPSPEAAPPAPAPAPAVEQATLLVNAIAVRQSDVRDLASLVKNPGNETLDFAFVPMRGLPPSFNLGTLTEEGKYVAPAVISRPAGFEGSLQATVLVTSGSRGIGEIAITLIPGDSFVIADDALTQGLVGNVYDFGGRSVDRLPDYDKMTPVASVVMPDVHVPLRSFSAGFPGVPDLFEWFGIRFTGRLKIDVEGEYTFLLAADDGARFYVNETLIVDNDGVHASRTRSGKVHLAPGLHDIRLDYFQGPRYHIHAELFWKKPGETAQSLVPAESLFRPVP